MYVYMYACIYVRMYNVYVYMYACIYVCIYNTIGHIYFEGYKWKSWWKLFSQNIGGTLHHALQIVLKQIINFTIRIIDTETTDYSY